MGWERSLVARRRRDALLRVPVALRLQLQRLLPALDDGAVAADAAWHWHRTTRAHGESGLGGLLRFDLLCLQCAVGHLLRRSFGERGAGRTVGSRRLFL